MGGVRLGPQRFSPSRRQSRVDSRRHFPARYLTTLWRLSVRVRTKFSVPEQGALQLPLLLSFIAVGGILVYEGVEFLPQTVLPVWLIWALVETWLRQTSPQPRQKAPAVRRARKIASSPLFIQRT